MTELSAEDRYLVRKTQMDADKRALEAQRAQKELERLVLEMEHKYGLLASEKTLDPRTGTVQDAAAPVRANGRGASAPLVASVLEEKAA